MKFSAADQTAILAATGQPVSLDFYPTIGKLKEAGKLVQMYDGSVNTTGPLLILSEADAALVTENSTIITIIDTDVTFQVTQKLPDGAGFVECELTKDYDA